MEISAWAPLTDPTVDAPLRWRKPRPLVMVAGDLFGRDVADSTVAHVFAAAALTPASTFVAPTVHARRARDLLSTPGFEAMVRNAAHRKADWPVADDLPWPLPNLILGARASNRVDVGDRLDPILAAPAAGHALIVDPLTGSIGLCRCDGGNIEVQRHPFLVADDCPLHGRRRLSWVFVAGGSEPVHPAWVRRLRDACQVTSTPFWFAGRGDWTWDDANVALSVPQHPFTDRAALLHPAGMTAMTRSNPFEPLKAGHPGWGCRVDRVGRRWSGRAIDGQEWLQPPTRTGVGVNPAGSPNSRV